MAETKENQQERSLNNQQTNNSLNVSALKTKITDVPLNHRGWLRRYANFVKGYRRRHFVVNGPFLEYYQREEDFGIKECSGRLDIRKCFIRIVGDLNFIIIEGDKKWFIRSESTSERSKWIVNIQNIKVLLNESGDSSISERERCMSLISQLESKLKDLIFLNKELQINGDCLLSIFNEVNESSQIKNSALSCDSKIFFESVCNYRSQTNNFKNYVSQMISLILDTHKSMQNVIACEIKERQNLEAIIDAMAERFENEISRSSRPTSNSISNLNLNQVVEDKLKNNINSDKNACSISDAKLDVINDDCPQDDSYDSFKEALSHNIHSSINHETLLPNNENEDKDNIDNQENIKSFTEKDPESNSVKLNCTEDDLIDMSDHKSPLLPSRRTQIEPRKTFSIVSILTSTLRKSTHIKDLAKISMPVYICEPLSYLQRMSECLQNSYLLDKAANTTNPGEELVFIAAFLASSYSSTAFRLNKPFNPLLYETYEWDRTDDLGWKVMCEQVNHHPPTSALHAESNLWELIEDVTLKSNISLSLKITVRPEGSSMIKLKTNSNIITLSRPNTKINGITYGSPWVENSGDCEIINHTTGYYCKLVMKEASWTKNSRSVEGIVYKPSGVPLFALTGVWNKEISYGLIDKQNNCSLYITIWKEETKFDEDRRLMYNMPDFALQMNEIEPSLSPTDSRNRKDIQCLEQGNHELADYYKAAYEEEQRQRRFAREKLIKDGITVAEIKPVYFDKTYDSTTKQHFYKPKGNYWKAKASQNWENPIDIFYLPEKYSKD